ncbi:DDE superfamily endonuclease [Popillia japonica]|uniref:DDE superfamily endonuclease n=1 Tax=Popillia japonica TaxID=7064 RepID=A0AAW1JWE8_POPJA
MIFPRVHFKEFMTYGAPPGTLGLATKRGRMNTDCFIQVVRHFIKHTNSSKSNPSLLILDNHESHLSIEAIAACKDNGVTMLTIPPHCTNKLQPLDVGLLKPFQTFYNAALDVWMMNHS